jgi:Ribbon-helix-helix domain
VQIELPDQTVQDLQALLAKRGDGVDVSVFVNQTLQRAIFFDTVRELKRQNADADPEELDRLVDEAVEAVRAERGRATRDADRA